jgi:hypothetical protein
LEARTRLLADKVREAVVTNERCLMLLMVLLTAGGEADLTAPAWNGFRRRFGEPALHAAVSGLADSGIVAISGTWVRLNVPPTPEGYFREAVDACGEAILQQAVLRFGRLILKCRETREGKYLLDVLAGLAECEGGPDGLCQVLGAQRWGELQWELEFQGILAPVARPGESLRLEVFAPFQGLVAMLYALVHWAAIARQVRPDHGVLYQDATAQWGQGIVDLAIRLELLTLQRWHTLLVLAPSRAGAEVAARGLAHAVAEAEGALQDLVHQVPRPFVRYLLRHLQNGPTLLQDEPEPTAPLCCDDAACLLQDPEFRQNVHAFLGSLVELNLAVSDVHGYVATGGGQLRGRYFAVAPEAIVAMAHLVPEVARVPALEGGSELLHRFLHLFGALQYDAGVTVARLQGLAQERQIAPEAFTAALRHLEQDGIVQVARGGSAAADPVVSVLHWPELYRRYHQPMVRSLLQPEPPVWDSFGAGRCS